MSRKSSIVPGSPLQELCSIMEMQASQKIPVPMEISAPIVVSSASKSKRKKKIKKLLHNVRKPT